MSRQQQAMCHHLNRPLKRIILENLLESGTVENLDLAYLALDILKICDDKNFQETVSNLLVTLFNDSRIEIKKYLGMVLEICKNGGGVILLTCASTKKNQYYSAQTLTEIIESIQRVYFKTKELNILTFPCYDEEGKGIIDKILDGSYQTRLINSPPSLALNSTSEKTTSEKITLTDLIKILDHSAFNESKSKAIQYLSSLEKNNRSAMVTYLKFFSCLEDQKNKTVLCNTGIVALVKLTIVSTTRQKSSLPCEYSLGDLEELLEESKNVCENYGVEMLLTFCNSFEFQKEVFFDDLLRLLKSLNTHSSNFEIQNFIYDISDKFAKNEINLHQFLEGLENQIADSGIDFTIEPDVKKLLIRFANDKSVAFPLSAENIKKLEEQYIIVNKYCQTWSTFRIGTLINMAVDIREKAKKNQLSMDEILQLVSIGRLTLRIKFSAYLYNTQILALLGLLNFQKSAIAQIKTGEGKSLIVALLAFVLGMQNKHVHIVSSSGQLAMRDEEKTSKFFKNFGLSTSNICQNYPEAKNFQGDLIYGTTSDFQFGILREMLHFEKLFPEKLTDSNDPRFDAVIIDEADNLTIDTALNGARESFPAEISFDWVYPPIMKFIQEKFNATSTNLDTENQISNLKEYLRKYMNGKFLSSCELLSDDQLKKWLKSAFQAIFVETEKKSYVITQTKDANGESVESVVIMDSDNTGRLKHGMRWSAGVHEFIEVKHGIEIKQESLTPLSISNSVFYPMYKTCFGLTGTLGSKSERESLKEIYSIDSFDVPPHKPQMRHDQPPRILGTDEELFQAVLQSVKSCQKQKRPVLVICKSIYDSEVYESLLKKESIPFELFNEMQKKSEEEIIGKAGIPGAITIATNNAGRGTDIKLQGESLQNGGLHVILTFYPESDRVEDQARGRAGRQGQCGSSEILLSAEQMNIKYDNRFDLEKQKEFVELLAQQRKKQAHSMKHIHSSRSTIERYLFSLACNFYGQLAKFHKCIEDEALLTELSALMCDRIIKRNEPNFSHLNSKDRQIAMDAYKLIADGTGSISLWKTVFKQSIIRIKNKMIVNWVENFYQPAQDLINATNFYKDISIEELLMKILTNDLTDGNKNQKNNLKNLLKNIEGLYEKNRVIWNQYLNSSGDGIMFYLREITGLALIKIGSSSGNLLAPNFPITEIPQEFLGSENIQDIDVSEKQNKFIEEFLKILKVKEKEVASTTPIIPVQESIHVKMPENEPIPSTHPITPIHYPLNEYGFSKTTIPSNGKDQIIEIIDMSKPSNVIQRGDLTIKGIPNIGNSCYMNAALQSLLAIPNLLKRFEEIDVSKIVLKQNKMVVEALRNFFEIYKDPSAYSDSLASAARNLRRAFYEAGDIDPSRQKLDLENYINEQAREDEKKDLHRKLEACINNDLLLQHDAIVIVHSILNLLGDGVAKLEIKSPTENHLKAIREVTTPAPTYLLLPMDDAIKQNKFRLKDFIHDYFRLRKEGSDLNRLATINSDTGKEDKSISWNEQILIVGPPPPFITLQINRLFSCKKDGTWSEELRRDLINLEPEEEYNLSKYFEEIPMQPTNYRVCAVIKQSGSSSNGHYVTVKKVLNSNEWIYCNDSEVNPIAGDNLKNEMSQGYIYFLEKI